MSARFSTWRKLNPIWWFGNADDPDPPIWFWPSRDAWVRRLGWWVRNPFHNLVWYVVGCADRWFVRLGTRYPSNFKETGGWVFNALFQAWPPFLCPFVSYRGRKWEWYIGWRDDGCFGIAVRRHTPAAAA